AGRIWVPARRDPVGSPARARPAARARALRHLHALHRSLSDRRDRRALPARRAALHILSHDRARRRDPAGPAAARRRLDLRLRRVPGGLPVEPLRAPGARARLHARKLEDWTRERFLTLAESGFDALFAARPIR